MKNLFLLMAVVSLAACQMPASEANESKMSDEDIVGALKQNAANLQDAILTQNLEEFNKYVDQNIASLQRQIRACLRVKALLQKNLKKEVLRQICLLLTVLLYCLLLIGAHQYHGGSDSARLTTALELHQFGFQQKMDGK